MADHAGHSPTTPAMIPFDTHDSIPAAIHRICLSLMSSVCLSSAVAPGHPPGAMMGGMRGWDCMVRRSQLYGR